MKNGRKCLIYGFRIIHSTFNAKLSNTLEGSLKKTLSMFKIYNYPQRGLHPIFLPWVIISGLGVKTLQLTGVDILQKKPKNALTGKNSAPAKLSNISRIK